MLVTIVVSSGTKSYTTQHSCASWNEVVPTLLASPAFREFCQSALPITNTKPLAPDEVFPFIPMEPLVETWCAQGGRAGEYFTAICVRTAESAEHS